MEYFEQRKAAVFAWIQNSPKSYVIYVLSTIILFAPSFIIYITSPEYFDKYVTIAAYVFLPAVLIAFLMDAKWLIWEFAKMKIGKLIYAILAYFAYTKAEIMAKGMVYDVTSIDPDKYASAVKMLIGMYFIPAWFTIITNVLVIMIFLVAIVSLLLMPKKESYRMALQTLLHKIGLNWQFHRGIGGHILFFYLGLVFFMAMFTPLTQAALKYIPQKEMASKMIFESSYYPDKTCSRVSDGTFVKLLGENEVSVANIHAFDLYKLMLDANYPIKFQTKQCN